MGFLSNVKCNALRSIFNKHDLMGIYFDKRTNFDEYDPEINELLCRLERINSLKDVHKELFDIFRYMFSKDLVKNKKDYLKMSQEVYYFLVNNRLVYPRQAKI